MPAMEPKGMGKAGCCDAMFSCVGFITGMEPKANDADDCNGGRFDKADIIRVSSPPFVLGWARGIGSGNGNGGKGINGRNGFGG